MSKHHIGKYCFTTELEGQTKVVITDYTIAKELGFGHRHDIQSQIIDHLGVDFYDFRSLSDTIFITKEGFKWLIPLLDPANQEEAEILSILHDFEELEALVWMDEKKPPKIVITISLPIRLDYIGIFLNELTDHDEFIASVKDNLLVIEQVQS